MQLSNNILTKGIALGLLSAVGTGSLITLNTSSAGQLVYALNPSSGQTGTCVATIDGTRLSVTVTGADPDTVHTVWVDFRSRATLMTPPGYPPDAVARGVAPAFASTDGVTAGMGPDRNSFKTDGNGDAVFTVSLDYDLLKFNDCPVVSAELGTQGANLVGGHWMRVYRHHDGASAQVVDATTGLPVLRRSTAAGLTIVKHPDGLTHGHTPGVGGVDHSGAFSGDFP